MAQRLTLCTCTAGATGLIPGQGSRILHAIQCRQRINKLKNKIKSKPPPPSYSYGKTGQQVKKQKSEWMKLMSFDTTKTFPSLQIQTAQDISSKAALQVSPIKPRGHLRLFLSAWHSQPCTSTISLERKHPQSVWQGWDQDSTDLVPVEQVTPENAVAAVRLPWSWHVCVVYWCHT